MTKDGVTVAEEVDLQDKYENMGAQLVKEAATKTSDAAGDGTTTATVLAEAIYKEGLKNLAAGADAMALCRGIKRAVDAACGGIADLAKPVKVSGNVVSDDFGLMMIVRDVSDVSVDVKAEAEDLLGELGVG